MTGNAILIRIYKDGDEEGIVKLFKQVFGREMSLDEWRWKYMESYPKKVYSSVAVHKDFGIVGHYGGVCLPLIHKSNQARGLVICDVMIHAKFRGIKTLKLLSSIMPREAVKDGIIIGYGFPNINTLLKPALSLGLYEKVEDVLEGNKDVTFNNNSTRYAFRFLPLNYSDARIDHLWGSCKSNLSLSVVRNRQYLEWRYKNHPFHHYELWGLRKRFGRRLLGIAILRKEKDRVLLIDFLSIKDMLKPLFNKVENYVYSTGMKTLSLWFPPFMEKKIIALGFSTNNAHTSIPRTTYEGFITREEMAGKFFYTMGDTDFL